MIHDMKINIAALAIGHPTIQNIQREGQRFERAVADLAIAMGKTQRECHEAIAHSIRHFSNLDDVVAAVAASWSPPEPVDAIQTPADIPTPDPAPTCPPIGARLGRRLGVRRR